MDSTAGTPAVHSPVHRSLDLCFRGLHRRCGLDHREALIRMGQV